MKFIKILVQEKGFSLIEISIVFALLAAVTGIGLFSFLDFSRIQEVDQGAKDVASFVERARSNATSFVKPEVCGSRTLDGYRVTYCDNGDCMEDGHYEMRVICGPQEHVVDTLNVSENITHLQESNCRDITYRIPQGSAEGYLPCTQVLDRSGRLEYVTVNGLGHVLFGEEGQLAAGNTPTPQPPTPTQGLEPTNTPAPTSVPTPGPCAQTEEYLEWDVGDVGQADMTFCRNAFTGGVRYSPIASCSSNETEYSWHGGATTGNTIYACYAQFTGVVRYSQSSQCPSGQNSISWRRGVGLGPQIRACVSSHTGSIRLL